MEFVVLVVLSLTLVGIAAAAVMILGVALSRGKQG